MTLVTANYHGFDPDSDVDPVWLCLFGDHGNTGMINWKCPADDKTEIFEKTNKHYMTFEANDIGNIKCIRCGDIMTYLITSSICFCLYRMVRS